MMVSMPMSWFIRGTSLFLGIAILFTRNTSTLYFPYDVFLAHGTSATKSIHGELHSTIQYNTIQYNTIQYNTIQYNTIQYNTIQYNTNLFSLYDLQATIFQKKRYNNG